MAVTEFKNKAEYDSAITANKIVIVDASAVWCGPCKAIAPVYKKLSEDEKFKDILFAKFDVDEVADLAKHLGVTAMPTFFAIKDGEKVDLLQGANLAALTKLIEKTL
ncbi:thioredoxin [Ophiostoma piceae UAMH 11346]|uniref:Thioredoxin n=1 Tax=Ophiostoma piceae (strain UAMH 11346) TaxID=1262450 RepID=S3BT15_OPHP1|nr:thioredoxin [Ophiostoma piceae UAMH 11346]